MGTTWQVTVTGEADQNLKSVIQRELDLVDTLMSTWRDDSEISRFNVSEKTDWFPVSKQTAAVVQASLDVSAATDGAFDVTVSPLIDLWKFDQNTGRGDLPAAAAIEETRTQIGWQQLSVRQDPPALKKSSAALSVNLSAIAKGYAVDRVAAALSESGLESFLVEVGGEVRAAGLSPRGEPWTVGIEEPADDRREIRSAVSLQDRAMATSGDYRNFYMIDGQRYSHTIDPRTGRPVEHALASVTVLTESCMLADAWATAISVLGPEAGSQLAGQQGLVANLIVRTDAGFQDETLGNFPAVDAVRAGPVPPSSMWPVFLAAAIVFLLAIGGMAVGVIISNRRLKGSCGGLAGMKDGAGQTACDLCAIPSAECRGEGAQVQAESTETSVGS